MSRTGLGYGIFYDERGPIPMNRQDSLYDQMKTVYDLAVKARCYDAADMIKKQYLTIQP